MGTQTVVDIQIPDELVQGLEEVRNSGKFNMVNEASSVVNELINMRYYREVSFLVGKLGRIDFSLYTEALNRMGTQRTVK